ncbi:MAG: hypothetical protein ACRDG7_05250 [Candidatus Limnocylindria bacterium]
MAPGTPLSATLVASWRAALRPEDGVLAAWIGLGAPALTAVGGTEVAESPLAGAVIVASVVAAIICLGTRPRHQPRVELGETNGPRWILAGPLVGALGLVSSIGIDHLGLADDAIVAGPISLAAIAALVANPWLPVLDATLRRVLVLPFTLVAGTIFAGFSADVVEGLDPSTMVGSIGTPEATFVAFVVVMLLGGLGAFYAMLVVAPRQLADPEDAGFRWVIRFGLFLVAALTGIGWLNLIG